MRTLSALVAVLPAGAALALVVPACGGGETKPAESPQASTSADGGPTGPSSPGDDVSGGAKGDYDKGYKAWMAGDLKGAKQGFSDAAKDDSKAAAPHYALGAVYERMGDASSAQQEYRTAFSNKPDYEPAIGAYALSLANSGHAGEADTFLTDKHQKMPNSALVTTYLAEVKSLENDSGSCQQLAQQALSQQPDLKYAMVTIARDHYRAGRLELAKYALQAILDGFGDESPPRDKTNAEAHLLRGMIEKQGGQRAAAMADFEAARASRPDLVEALVQVGVMKLEAGNVVDATPLLESAVRYAPNSALAHLNLGDCYRLAGRPADAKKEFDTALSLDSSLAVVHYDVGLLYLFAPSIPGTSASDQIATAIRELNTYKTMRGAKPAPGVNDDIDSLLSRANAKQAELSQAAATKASAPPPSKDKPATPAKPGAQPPAAPAAPAPPAPPPPSAPAPKK